MLSPSLRKSVTDLTRRPARAVLTVLTLALAVASISFFAIPSLIDRAMQQEVRAGHLADLRLSMRPVQLTDRQLSALAGRHPDVRFILAHIAGGGDWEHSLAAVRDVSNVLVDLSGSGVFDRTGPARLALITCGGEFDEDLRSYRDNVVVLASPAA